MAEHFGNDNAANTLQWYVMRAYKKELAAEQALSKAEGWTFFLPKRRVWRIRHGERRQVLVPAIPNLLFVYATRRDILSFKQSCPYLQFAIWRKTTGTVYLTVPDRQMQDFIRVTNAALEQQTDILFSPPEGIDLKRGTRVRVRSGELEGLCGTLLKLRGKRAKRVVVMLENVAAASIELPPELIEPI